MAGHVSCLRVVPHRRPCRLELSGFLKDIFRTFSVKSAASTFLLIALACCSVSSSSAASLRILSKLQFSNGFASDSVVEHGANEMISNRVVSVSAVLAFLGDFSDLGVVIR